MWPWCTLAIPDHISLVVVESPLRSQNVHVHYSYNPHLFISGIVLTINVHTHMYMCLCVSLVYINSVIWVGEETLFSIVFLCRRFLEFSLLGTVSYMFSCCLVFFMFYQYSGTLCIFVVASGREDGRRKREELGSGGIHQRQQI